MDREVGDLLRLAQAAERQGPAEGLQLLRSRVMGVNRIELTGFTEGMRERLRAYGLFSEIISWKLRFFVPVGPDAAGVLAKLFSLWPISRISEREVA